MSVRPRALVTVLRAAATGTSPAATAHAEGRTAQGGRLERGIRTSYQRGVTGPVAKGSHSLTGGAATVGGSGSRRAVRPPRRP